MLEDFRNLLLNLPKEEYIKFKKDFEKMMKFKKDEYSNLNIIFDSLKQKNIHLSFLLFSQYKKWIFPSFSYKILFLSTNLFLYLNFHQFLNN